MTEKGLSRAGSGQDIQAVGLDEIAKGITLVLDELREIGLIGSAGAGRGFSQLELSGLELGHEGVMSAFKSFCERWEWGVRALVDEGNDFAEGVGLSAGTLYETDRYVDGALKIGANALVGNPYASEEEVAGKSWGQLAGDTVDAYLHPDYSQESFGQAWDNSKQGWKDAARDAMSSQVLGSPESSPLNMQRMMGLDDSEFEHYLDSQFGPSPEERAAAAQQQAPQDGQAG